MARPRTPTAILETRGAFKKNPQRRRPEEPKVGTGLGEPPADLTALERAAWEQIARECAKGVLTGADRIAVEIASRLLARFREEGDLPGAKLAQLSSLLGRFGMTPADRSKVHVEKKQPENEFAEFLN